MISPVLITALGAGFFGSPHCLGMCGGIVMAFGMAMKDLSARQRRLLIATYHAGRIASYMLLGTVAGVLGQTVMAQWQQTGWPRFVLGLAVLLIGLGMLGLARMQQMERAGLGLWQRMAPLRKALFPMNSVPRALGAGLLWGFLPCGLVYSALLLALAAGSGPNGALVMLLFGLGTLPMLLASQAAAQRLASTLWLHHLRRLAGATVILSGLWMIVGGSGLLHHVMPGRHAGQMPAMTDQMAEHTMPATAGHAHH